jgi:NAD(P)H-flavin reductase
MATTEAAQPVEPASDPMRPEPFEVRHVTKETGDTFTLTLAPVARAPFRPFAPGQFNMLYVFGVGEVPISISGDPARPEILVHTIRSVGATTRAMQKLQRGDWVGVRGPFGTAWPVDKAHGHDVVLIAGGIGLAPIRPALYHVLLHRGLYGRVVLLYGARTPRDMLFPKELREWRGRFDVVVDVTVDRATMEWQGSVGVVTKMVQRSPFDPQSAMAFICGPEVMIRYAAQSLEQRGTAGSSIFVSMERNMKCAVGVCGHCQFGPWFVCKDGPVFRYDRIERFFGMREV